MAETLLGLSKEAQEQRTIDGAEWDIVKVDGTSMLPEEYAAVRALEENRLIGDVEMGIVQSTSEITWINVTAAPIPLEKYGVVVTYFDITARKQAEDRIKAALREKEVLLAEIHHRVKNNLQIVSSMLNFQTFYTNDEQILDILRDCQRRVHSMALIHAQLYRAADLAQIDFGGYVENLASELFAAYRTNAQHIALKIEIDDVFFEVKQAIPCGLLINELMSNALKYAFPAGWERPGEADNEIRVALSLQEDGQYVLIVGDNGAGLPPDFTFPTEDTLGMFLIDTFAEQLEGTVEWHNENGTTCTIVFTITT